MQGPHTHKSEEETVKNQSDILALVCWYPHICLIAEERRCLSGCYLAIHSGYCGHYGCLQELWEQTIAELPFSCNIHNLSYYGTNKFCVILFHYFHMTFCISVQQFALNYVAVFVQYRGHVNGIVLRKKINIYQNERSFLKLMAVGSYKVDIISLKYSYSCQHYNFTFYQDYMLLRDSVLQIREREGGREKG